MNGCMAYDTGTVEISRSNWFVSRFIASVSLHSTASRAPSRLASATLPGEVVNKAAPTFKTSRRPCSTTPSRAESFV